MSKLLLIFLAAVAASQAACTKTEDAKPKAENCKCTASVTKASGTHAPSSFCSGDLIFQEEFDSLNFKKWQHESTLGGGGNWEFQWYTNNRTNSFVYDGSLYLKPTLTSESTGEDFLYSGTLSLWGGAPADECTNNANYGCERTGNAQNILNPIKSARLRTVYSFSFTYGRVETRAKMPKGDWLWPAIWLMPRDSAYGGWPTSGEIDLLESRGNENLVLNGVNIGTHMIGSTLHWGPDYYNNRYEYTHFEKVNSEAFSEGFHVYALEWTPDYIKFFIDGSEIGTVTPPAGGFWELGNLESTGYSNPWEGDTKMAPFDQEFYIIINLAVGGTAYFPDDATNPGGKPWSNNSPTAFKDFWEGRSQWLSTWNLDSLDSALQVDYVRVYAL